MSSTTVNALTDSLPNNIPTLNSAGKNWAIFELRFISAVQGKGKWGHFDGSAPRPAMTNPTVSLITNLEDWLKDEASARNMLLSKVPDSIALKLRKHTTVETAWAALVAEFTEKSGYAQTDLRQDFLDSYCPGKGNVREFLEKLETKKESLAAVGILIDDMDYRSTILRGIPQHYSDFASSVLTAAKLMNPSQPITPSALATSISEEYDRQVRRKSNAKSRNGNGKEGDDDEALVVAPSTTSGGSKGSSKVTCWKCGEKGHVKRDCPKKGKTPASGKGSGGSANAVESDSDREAGGAFALASDSSSLPSLQDVSDSDIWSDTDSVYVKEESGEESEDVSSFFEMEDVTIPDLPDGFEEDWSDIQSFRSSSDSDRVISLESDGSSEPVVPVSKATDVPSSARSELYDSGCSRHISPYRDDFSDFKSIPPKSFRAANKQKFDAVGTGSITVDVPNGVDVNSLHLTEVLYSPEVGYTLISMGKLDDHGFSATFADGKCTIRGPDGDPVGEVPKTKGGLYRVDRGGVEEEGVAAVETISLDQLHRRMGHISPKVARHMVTKGFVTGVKLDNEGLQDIFCESCVYAKATRKPVAKERKEGSRAKKFGEEVHSDLWGPAPVQSLRGKRYYISFIDDSSRYTYLEFLHRKNEAFRAYLEYEAWVKTTFDVPVKTLHSDNGGEYTGKEFVVHLKENGTHQKLSVHDTPQHNGVAERYNRTLVEKIRAMLHSSGLPRTLWAEAARHAVWVLNRTSTKSLDGKTPLEAATGKKPDLRDLREWGTKVWVRLEKGDKLGGRVKEGRWVGVSEKRKGFRIYWPDIRKITVERNVYSDKSSAEIDRVEGEDWEFNLPIPSQNAPPTPIPSSSTPPVPSPEPTPTTRHERKPSQRVRDLLEGRGRSSNRPQDPNIPKGVQLSNIREDPATVAEELEGEDEDWALLLEDDDFLTEYAMVLETSDSEALEPNTLAEAKRRPDWPLWEKAIEEELKLLTDMGTWEVVKKPEGVNVVGSKWVFKAKKDATGNVVRYKARLVAQGFSQVPGVDYFDTYAPVARMASIRAILAMAAHFDMELHQIDIKGAYLNGRLTNDERIYMSQPPGYPTPGTSSRHVLRLLKTLYGLKQSGRRWYQRLVEILVKNLGFTQCEVDQAVF